MTNLDNHMDEYKAEQAAKEAAEEAAKEAERLQIRAKWAAEEAEARKARIARNEKFLANIARAAETLSKGFGSEREIVHDKENGKLSFAGVDVTRWIHISEDTTKEGYRTVGKGTFSIRIGDGYRRGDTIRYKERHGSHDYPAIATVLMSRANQELVKQRARSQAEINDVKAEELRTELKLNRFGLVLSLRGSVVADRPYFVKLNLNVPMTEDQVRKLVLAMNQIGVKLD